MSQWSQGMFAGDPLGSDSERAQALRMCFSPEAANEVMWEQAGKVNWYVLV